MTGVATSILLSIELLNVKIGSKQRLLFI
jgi:hypothetical protein